jgi:hypothetical protein
MGCFYARSHGSQPYVLRRIQPENEKQHACSEVCRHSQFEGRGSLSPVCPSIVETVSLGSDAGGFFRPYVAAVACILFASSCCSCWCSSYMSCTSCQSLASSSSNVKRRCFGNGSEPGNCQSLTTRPEPFRSALHRRATIFPCRRRGDFCEVVVSIASTDYPFTPKNGAMVLVNHKGRPYSFRSGGGITPSARRL